jgi:LPS-assembly lipoprotein
MTARVVSVKIASLLMLGMAVLLSACGWHLRGTLTLPEGLNSVYLHSESDAQLLGRTMEQLLVANQVGIAERQAAAQLIIKLLDFTEDRRVVAVGDNTLVTEYELIATADFSVENARGEVILPPSDVSVIRAYQFDQDNVLGMAEEQQLILQEMRREIAQQIIRRLRFLDLQNEPDIPAESLRPY